MKKTKEIIKWAVVTLSAVLLLYIGMSFMDIVMHLDNGNYHNANAFTIVTVRGARVTETNSGESRVCDYIGNTWDICGEYNKGDEIYLYIFQGKIIGVKEG